MYETSPGLSGAFGLLVNLEEPQVLGSCSFHGFQSLSASCSSLLPAYYRLVPELTVHEDDQTWSLAVEVIAVQP